MNDCYICGEISTMTATAACGHKVDVCSDCGITISERHVLCESCDMGTLHEEDDVWEDPEEDEDWEGEL